MRVAVVGAGYWGRNLVRNFHALGALGAICDRSALVLEEAREKYPGIATYDDIDRLFSDSEINAVAIATPAQTHGDLIELALIADRNVFVEKPLCLDVTRGRLLAAEAKRRGLLVMVGHLLLYHPAFVELLRWVRNGRLGKLRYVYANRASLGKIRREENALWSFAPHDISMMLALAGAMPKRVVANGGHYLHPDVADMTLSHLQFPNGLQGHIFVSWLHPYKDHRLVTVGETGMIVFDDTEPPERKLIHYDHDVGWNGDIPVINKAPSEPIAIDWQEPLRIECETFLRCLSTGGAPPSDADEGLRVLEVLNACQQSLSKGETVFLEDAES